MKTPMTYYGGKQQLVPLIIKMLPNHTKYCEPFFGGGAVFFSKNKSTLEYINDLNSELMNFFQCIKSQPDELQTSILGTLYSESLHVKSKRIYKNPKRYTAIERATAIFVITQQSLYSSLDTVWHVSTNNSRYSTYSSKKRIDFSMYAKRMEETFILCRDAINVIQLLDSNDSFFYVDPPYFNSECRGYRGYHKQDFINLLDTLSNIKGKFLLSSYPSDILQQYTENNKWNQKQILVTKSASMTGKQKIECLTYNYNTEDDKQLFLF